MPHSSASRSERRSVNTSHLRYKKPETEFDEVMQDCPIMTAGGAGRQRQRENSGLCSVSMSIDQATPTGIASFMQRDQLQMKRFKEK